MSFVEKALQKMIQVRDDWSPRSLPPATDREIAAARSTTAALATLEAAKVAMVPAARLHIDRENLRRDGLLPPHEHERHVQHEFRQIKRRLMENAFGRNGNPCLPAGNLIMVTSALPGDGKTFLTTNLAFSFARELDMSVLLIDADVAKAHVSRALGVEEKPGLMDALRSATHVESLILSTDVEGLSVLPAGTFEEQATELLSGDRMQVLLEQLCAQRQNRIVLFDSPPLLLTNEAPALARRVGQIVLVVRSSITAKHAVLDAVALLDNRKFIGLVFNESRRRATKYYGYYDAYGYGGRRAATAAAKRASKAG